MLIFICFTPLYFSVCLSLNSTNSIIHKHFRFRKHFFLYNYGMSTKTNSAEQKNDNKLLITIVVLIVVLFFILPIVAVGLITFGTFKFIDNHMGEVVDIAKDGISYMDDHHDSLTEKTNHWSAIYTMAMSADLPNEGGARPIISSSICKEVDDVAGIHISDYSSVCDSSEISVKVEKDDSGEYKTLTFGSNSICTRLALDSTKQKVISGIQYSIAEDASCGDTQMILKAASDSKEEDDSKVEVDLPGVHVDVE